jgi:hypothetical protein
MTHQQILDKLSAVYMVQSIKEDLKRLTYDAMSTDRQNCIGYILPRFLLRWNCALSTKKDIPVSYKHQAILATAVVLHRNGFTDETITTEAIKAIDSINEEKILSDDFLHKSERIKEMITSPPIPLKRKPSLDRITTFYKPNDIISIELEGRFYPAFVHRLTDTNESPVIEFYNGVFDQVPRFKEVVKLPAKGEVYNDGVERIRHLAVFGMKFTLDPAKQVRIIGSSEKRKPANQHLEKPIGSYAVTDLFRLQDIIKRMFETAGK